MAQQNNDNQMWLRKEKRDIFTRVANTLIMQGALEKGVSEIAKKITDNAFEYYPEPEEIIPITDGEKLDI